MKVKNGSCIRHLSFKTLMSAKKRNIIAVLAIALVIIISTYKDFDKRIAEKA